MVARCTPSPEATSPSAGTPDPTAHDCTRPLPNTASGDTANIISCARCGPRLRTMPTFAHAAALADNTAAPGYRAEPVTKPTTPREYLPSARDGRRTESATKSPSVISANGTASSTSKPKSTNESVRKHTKPAAPSHTASSHRTSPSHPQEYTAPATNHHQHPHPTAHRRPPPTGAANPSCRTMLNLSNTQLNERR